MLSNKYTECSQCGMVVNHGEYHPYAACLMFIACKDGDKVRANLDFVRKQDTELIRQMREALNTCIQACDYLSEIESVANAQDAALARLENT